MHPGTAEEQGWDNPRMQHGGEGGQQDQRCGGGPVRSYCGEGEVEGKVHLCDPRDQALVQAACRDLTIVLGSRYFFPA